MKQHDNSWQAAKRSSGKALTSGIWNILGSFLLQAISLISTPIFTRILTKSEMGILSSLLSAIGLVAIVITLQIPAAFNLAWYDHQTDIDRYTGSSLMLTSLTALLFSAVMFLFRDFIISYFSINSKIFALVLIYLFFYPSVQFRQIRWQLEYEGKKVLWLSLVLSVSTLLLSVLLVLSTDDHLTARMFGIYLPHIIAGIVIYMQILKHSKGPCTSYWPYTLKISLPTVWHLLAGQILSSSDRLMIKSMLGNEPTALYSVAYTCSTAVNMFWSAMNQSWAPWTYEQMNKDNPAAIRRAFKPYILFFCFLIVGSMLIAPEIIFYFGGKSYLEAVDVIPPVMTGFLMTALYTLFVNVEYFYKQQKMIAIGTTIAAVTNVALNAFFIPRFGYVAAAYTTLIGYTVLFLVHLLFVLRMKKAYYYDLKFIFVVIVCMGVITVSISLLYQRPLVRYLIILVVATVVLGWMLCHKDELRQGFQQKSLQPVLKSIFKDSL